MSFTVRLLMAALIGLLIGAGCRWFRIPVPAPPTLLGALLILTITGGYVLVDVYLPENSTSTSSTRHPSIQHDSTQSSVPDTDPESPGATDR